MVWQNGFFLLPFRAVQSIKHVAFNQFAEKPLERVMATETFQSENLAVDGKHRTDLPFNQMKLVKEQLGSDQAICL